MTHLCFVMRLWFDEDVDCDLCVVVHLVVDDIYSLKIKEEGEVDF